MQYIFVCVFFIVYFMVLWMHGWVTIYMVFLVALMLIMVNEAACMQMTIIQLQIFTNFSLRNDNQFETISTAVHLFTCYHELLHPRRWRPQRLGLGSFSRHDQLLKSGGQVVVDQLLIKEMAVQKVDALGGLDHFAQFLVLQTDRNIVRRHYISIIVKLHWRQLAT